MWIHIIDPQCEKGIRIQEAELMRINTEPNFDLSSSEFSLNRLIRSFITIIRIQRNRIHITDSIMVL